MQVFSLADAYHAAQSARMAEQEYGLREIAAQDATRQRQADEQIRALYADPGFDPSRPEGLAAVMRISPKTGMAIREQSAKIAKYGAETERSRMGAASDKQQIMGKAAIGAARQWDMLPPEQRTPERFKGLVETTRSVLAAAHPELGRDPVPDGITPEAMYSMAAAAGYESPNFKAMQAGQIAGAEAQSRQPFQQANDAYQAVLQANLKTLPNYSDLNPAAPSGYLRVPGGKLAPIPGGPADPAVFAERQKIETQNKPLTEDQGKTAGFLNEASTAHQKMLEMEQAGFDPTSAAQGAWDAVANAKVPFTDARPLAGAGMRDNDVQTYETFGKAFIAPVMYGKSGAQISQSEWETAKKLYFPQPGDSAKTVAAKKAMRERALEGLRLRAGRAADMVGDSQQQPPAQPAPIRRYNAKGEGVELRNGQWVPIR